MSAGGTSSFVRGSRPQRADCAATVSAAGAAPAWSPRRRRLRSGAPATRTPDQPARTRRPFPGRDGGSPIIRTTAPRRSPSTRVLATTSPAAGPLPPLVIHSDPDGDGDPPRCADRQTDRTAGPTRSRCARRRRRGRRCRPARSRPGCRRHGGG
jgi:hypothetical protein